MENSQAATQDIDLDTSISDEMDETQDNEIESGDSGSAPEEKVSFNEQQQVVFNDAIGKKVASQRAAEREAQELRLELQNLKADIPQPKRPELPDAPDPMDDDFEQKLKIREAALEERVRFDVQQDADTKFQEQEQAKAQNEAGAKLNVVATAYAEKAKVLGISDEALKAAGNVLKTTGISNELTLHILKDDKGPAITKYLADNPVVLDSMQGMTNMQAAIFIETKVKPIAGSLKQTTNAPHPSEILQGGGTPPTDRGPKGATFE